jgi:protein involved in polysaccharide export with SLBB domain
MPTSAQVTIGVTATVLVAANIADQTAYLHNLGGGAVYIGDANVTTSNGYKLDNGDKLTVSVGDHEGLYGIAASGTHVVSVLKQIN